jgi:hypothetical protein
MSVTVGNLTGGPASEVRLGPNGSEVDVGGTRGPVGYEETKDFVDSMVSQKKGVLKKRSYRRRFFVFFTMAEITLENLQMALDLPSSCLSASTLTVDEQDAQELTCIVTAPGKGDKTWTYTFTKVIAVEATTLPQYAEDDDSEIAIRLEVLQDSSDDSWYTVIES